MKNKKRMILVTICVSLVLMLNIRKVNAASKDTTSAYNVIDTYCSEEYAYVLLNQGNLAPDNVSCQINDTDCQIDEVGTVMNLECEIRTVCLIDISKSVTKSDQKRIKGIVKQLINQMGENEQMEISTIGSQLETIAPMTADKFQLYSSYEDLEYSKQATNITHIIPTVIDDISQSIESETCFYRVILFSDDYDNDSNNLEETAFITKLQNTSFQIDTVGSLHKDNKAALK